MEMYQQLPGVRNDVLAGHCGRCTLCWARKILYSRHVKRMPQGPASAEASLYLRVKGATVALQGSCWQLAFKPRPGQVQKETSSTQSKYSHIIKHTYTTKRSQNMARALLTRASASATRAGLPIETIHGHRDSSPVRRRAPRRSPLEAGQSGLPSFPPTPQICAKSLPNRHYRSLSPSIHNCAQSVRTSSSRSSTAQ